MRIVVARWPFVGKFAQPLLRLAIFVRRVDRKGAVGVNLHVLIMRDVLSNNLLNNALDKIQRTGMSPVFETPILHVFGRSGHSR